LFNLFLLDSLIGESQMAVDLFRPTFDEEKGQELPAALASYFRTPNRSTRGNHRAGFAET